MNIKRLVLGIVVCWLFCSAKGMSPVQNMSPYAESTKAFYQYGQDLTNASLAVTQPESQPQTCFVHVTSRLPNKYLIPGNRIVKDGKTHVSKHPTRMTIHTTYQKVFDMHPDYLDIVNPFGILTNSELLEQRTREGCPEDTFFVGPIPISFILAPYSAEAQGTLSTREDRHKIRFYNPKLDIRQAVSEFLQSICKSACIENYPQVLSIPNNELERFEASQYIRLPHLYISHHQHFASEGTAQLHPSLNLPPEWKEGYYSFSMPTQGKEGEDWICVKSPDSLFIRSPNPRIKIGNSVEIARHYYASILPKNWTLHSGTSYVNLEMLLIDIYGFLYFYIETETQLSNAHLICNLSQVLSKAVNTDPFYENMLSAEQKRNLLDSNPGLFLYNFVHMLKPKAEKLLIDMINTQRKNTMDPYNRLAQIQSNLDHSDSEIQRNTQKQIDQFRLEIAKYSVDAEMENARHVAAVSDYLRNFLNNTLATLRKVETIYRAYANGNEQPLTALRSDQEVYD